MADSVTNPISSSIVSQFSSIRIRVLVCFALLATATSSILGQSSKRWGTTFETQVGLGYDSNVYGTRDSALNDGFWNASQSIKIDRRNSLTRFEVLGTVERTDYFGEEEADYTDSSFSINAAYPEDKIDVSFYNASLFWNKQTRLNLDAGRRVQPTVYGARFAGVWEYSPKTGIVGAVSATTNDMSDQGFSKTDSVKLRAGVSREWGPESRWSLEYRLSRSESDSSTSSESLHHHFGVSGWGILTPKIRGNVFAGIRKSEFTGFYEFSDSGPNISADVTWSASQRFSATLGIENDYEFTANGNVQLLTTIDIRLKRDLGGGFRVTALVEKGHSDYELPDGEDGFEEDYWRLGGELEYAFTKRFYAKITASSMDSEASIPDRDTKRTLYKIFGGLRY